jgi:endonuclease/exonuclease/phosphatase family metal-dependent hydrolase
MAILKAQMNPRPLRLRVLRTLLFAAFLTAWAAAPAPAQVLSKGKGNLRVMTYNVYEGADLTPAFSATNPTDFALAVGGIIANVQATNPPARAVAVARQIGKVKPTLISLQEVTEWKTCPATPDLTGCSSPPTVLYNILNLVKDALQGQGLSYKEVARVTTNELSAPAITNSGKLIVFYTQRSAILARMDIGPGVLQFSNIQSDLFTHAFTVTTAVGPIAVHRAWISVDMKFHNRSFRFVDTQLEAFDPSVNYEQGEEILSGPAHTSKPVIIAMDSNSKANPPANPFTPTYTNFLVHGFTDAWTQTQGYVPGPTCCQSSTLTNPVSTVSNRIDLILVRGDFNPKTVELFGGQASDRTSGLWPSDHLGVAARLGTE